MQDVGVSSFEAVVHVHGGLVQHAAGVGARGVAVQVVGLGARAAADGGLRPPLHACLAVLRYSVVRRCTVTLRLKFKKSSIFSRFF